MDSTRGSARGGARGRGARDGGYSQRTGVASTGNGVEGVLPPTASSGVEPTLAGPKRLADDNSSSSSSSDETSSDSSDSSDEESDDGAAATDMTIAPHVDLSQALEMPDTPVEEVEEANDTRSKPVCRFFVKTGKCKFGDSCNFAHPVSLERDTPI